MLLLVLLLLVVVVLLLLLRLLLLSIVLILPVLLLALLLSLAHHVQLGVGLAEVHTGIGQLLLLVGGHESRGDGREASQEW